jgi:integrase
MGRAGRIGTGVELRDTSIRIVFTYQGKQVRETLYLNGAPLPPTPANAKYAARLADEIRNKVSNGVFQFAEYFPHSKRAGAAHAGTLADLMESWFKQLHLKPSTLATYRRMKDGFWGKHLGAMPIDKIKHSDVTTALAAGAWASGKTRNNHLSMLSSVFELAVADDLLAKNPCAGIGQATWQKKNLDPFTLAEAELILADMKAHYAEPVLNYYEFMFFTGLRTGEGIGLDWAECDLRTGTVLIKQAFVVDAIEDTKTSRERIVTLNSRALAALKRQKTHTFLAAGRVFLDPGTGQPWAYEQNARKRYWAPAIKRLGIRYRRPYAMRSTYATVGLMAGAQPSFMARQLGHSTEVFFRDYAAWINGESNAREMDKIEAQLARNYLS